MERRVCDVRRLLIYVVRDSCEVGVGMQAIFGPSFWGLASNGVVACGQKASTGLNPTTSWTHLQVLLAVGIQGLQRLLEHSPPVQNSCLRVSIESPGLKVHYPKLKHVIESIVVVPKPHTDDRSTSCVFAGPLGSPAPAAACPCVVRVCGG
jgi:hypothetical protein